MSIPIWVTVGACTPSAGGTTLTSDSGGKAVSTLGFAASGTHSLRFDRLSGSEAMIGLYSGNTIPPAFQSVEYNMYSSDVGATRSIYIYESGAFKTGAIACPLSTVQEIKCINGVVTYWAGGVLLYTSNTAAATNLYPSFYSIGMPSVFENFNITGLNPPADIQIIDIYSINNNIAGIIPVEFRPVGAVSYSWETFKDGVSQGFTITTHGYIEETALANGIWNIKVKAIDIGGLYSVNPAISANVILPTTIPTVEILINGLISDNIAYGSSGLLTWSSLNADSLQILGVNVAPSGSVTVGPLASAPFNLVSSKLFHIVAKTGQYTVTDGAAALMISPSIMKLTLDRSHIGNGQIAHGAVAITGTVSGYINNTIVNDGDNLSLVTWDAPIAIPIISFSVSPSGIISGSISTLSWNVTGATGVIIDNGIGAVSSSGSISVNPIIPTVYTLTATNIGGINSKQVFLDVNYISVPNGTFTSSPASITLGGNSTISWAVSGASGVIINNGIGSVSSNGSILVSPIVTTVYKLTATNAIGIYTQSTTVIVNPVSGIIPPNNPALISVVICPNRPTSIGVL